MSPTAQGNVEIDQYIFENNLIPRSLKDSGYQRQSPRQFHNSQTRGVHNFPNEPHKNNSRSPKFNQVSYPRQANFLEICNGWTKMPVVVPVQNNQRRYQYHVNNQYNLKQKKGTELMPFNNDASKQPFSHMAIHSQNPQMFLNNGKFHNHRNKVNFNRNNQKIYKHFDKSESCKQNQSTEPPIRSSDTLSNASDESSGQSENSLPRIIKPRKRRKKDRKPLTESIESQETSPVVETITTLKLLKKPQMKTHSGSVKLYTPNSCEETKTSITQTTESAPLTKVIQKVESSVTVDSVFNPLITDSFVNLILDDVRQSSKRPTVPDKPLDNLVIVKKIDDEPSTECQCRYCDPCGEIWDVEQRCYSPFLTPPAPNEPKIFINSIRSVISGNITKPSGAYLLRRSWSEPSESSLMSVRSRNKSDSYEPNTHDLQVSSEIITSPNGHRDIEIKFFSTAKRHSEVHKPNVNNVPYSQLCLPSPPISPWKKDVRFGDLFSHPNDIRSSVNISFT